MAPKKKAPPLIHSEAFDGADDLTSDDLESLRVSDKRDAADKLIANWTGGPVGMTVFHLSNDSRKVADVEFALFGTLYEDAPKIIATNKLFTGSGAKLVLTDLNLEIFKFENSLTSQIVDCSALNFSFKQAPQGPDLTEDEIRDKGLGAFSIRAHILPTLENYVKVELICFPLPAEALAELHPLSKDPRFPGIQLTAVGQVCVEPSQGDVLGDRSWGMPTLPAFLCPSSFTKNSPLPPTSLLRHAFGALMRSATKPTMKQNAKSLMDLWGAVKSSGVEALKSLPLDVAWPPPAPAAAAQGRYNLFFFVLISSRF